MNGWRVQWTVADCNYFIFIGLFFSLATVINIVAEHSTLKIGQWWMLAALKTVKRTTKTINEQELLIENTKRRTDE